MKFLKWLLLDVWTPLNIRFGIVYGFVAQLKFLAELMVILGAGYFFWFKSVPSHKTLVAIFIVLFLAAAGIGDLLIRLNIPQKINEKNNAINPQINAITEILEIINKIAEKLGVK